MTQDLKDKPLERWTKAECIDYLTGGEGPLGRGAVLAEELQALKVEELRERVAAHQGPAPTQAPEESYADRAMAILAAGEYSGKLTAELLRELEPLLREPIPDRYIETTEPTQGKPYVSTGVKSAQVQIDRLNDVLGASHWRALPHYEDGGKRCRVTVVVGNGLEWCRLDEAGNLLPYTLIGAGLFTKGDAEVKEAEVLVSRDGYGGHARGSAPGDVYKGSETNALKRVIARIGPGCDVYRMDYDEDTHSAKPPMEEGSSRQGGGRPANGQRGPARVQAGAQAPAGDASQPTEEELITGIRELLNDSVSGDEVLELREKAHAMMVELNVSAGRRLQELSGAKGVRGLESLIKRLENANAGGDS